MDSIEVINYKTRTGKEPLALWFDELEKIDQGRIFNRIAHVREGSFGDSKPVGDGVSELRMHFGPGYRIYYGKKGKTLVILLLGGKKSDQKKDIETAKRYWRDHKDRKL